MMTLDLRTQHLTIDELFQAAAEQTHTADRFACEIVGILTSSCAARLRHLNARSLGRTPSKPQRKTHYSLHPLRREHAYAIMRQRSVLDEAGMAIGKRWTVSDRYGNQIYLTEERWEHITESINHPEMAEYEEHLKDVLRSGHRKQDPLNPQKYRYSGQFTDLVEDNTHIVAIVLFRFSEGANGKPIANDYIVTAYQKAVW